LVILEAFTKIEISFGQKEDILFILARLFKGLEALPRISISRKNPSDPAEFYGSPSRSALFYTGETFNIMNFKTPPLRIVYINGDAIDLWGRDSPLWEFVPTP